MDKNRAAGGKSSTSTTISEVMGRTLSQSMGSLSVAEGSASAGGSALASSNGLAASIAPSSTSSRNRPAVVLDLGRLGEQSDLGDDRIKPALLRQLLLQRPDLAMLLRDCIEDCGLDDVSSDED